jgi:hypothetical protein
LISLPLAHGIGGVSDPPIPMWLAYYSAAAVLVLSFSALGALWKRPLLEDEARRPLLERTAALRVLFGTIGFALFLLVFFAALAGERSAGTNIAPTFVYVIFWLGLVPLVVIFGDVWRWLNPWRAAADAAAWMWSRSRLEWDPPFAYPERLGRWPAALLLFCFASLELAWTDPADPRALALAIAIYSWITWVGAAAFGRAAWFANGDAFSVYFGLLSRLSAFVIEDGRNSRRRLLAGVARRSEPPGTIAFVAVMLGSVAFDGFSRTSFWVNRVFGLSEAKYVAANVGGLAAGVVVVAVAFLLAVNAARLVAHTRERLADAFVGSLIPIALAYVVAHYFSLLLISGQLLVPLASDPFGYGCDLFGTIDYRINVRPVSVDTIWYVQTISLIAGHVLGLVIAHDRALALFAAPKVALRTQYALLALMVLYTVGGLWLLSRG